MGDVTYRYKYLGTLPCETYTPPMAWEPGDVKDVTEPITHVWFELLPQDKTKKTTTDA